MGPVSTVTRTFQKVIDLVVKPEQRDEGRGRSLHLPSSTSRTASPQSLLNSRKRSGTRSSPALTHNRGRQVHLLANSPPGYGRNIIRVPPTRHRCGSGQQRSLQESLNNKVDTSNPPPVPAMPPKWQGVINAIRGERKGEPRTEHEAEVRRNFEKMKKKQWNDLSPEQQAKETRDYMKNQKRVKAWILEKDITRQTRKVERANEEAEEKVREAANAKRRLERLKRRQGGQELAPKYSPKVVKRATKSEGAKEAPISDEDLSLDHTDYKLEGSNTDNSPHQTAGSGQAKKALSSSRQVKEYGDSQSRPQSCKRSTIPVSALPPKTKSAAPQRPSQNPRGNTDPNIAVISMLERVGSCRPYQDIEVRTAPGRPAHSEAPASTQQRSQPGAYSGVPASTRESSGGSGAQLPARAVGGRGTIQQILQPSQPRQGRNSNEVEPISYRRPALGQTRVAREGQSRLNEGSEAATRTPNSGQRLQTARSTKAGESGDQEPKSRLEKESELARTYRATLAALAETNLKNASDQFVVEAASAFAVDTELDRGPGDNWRTVIEGLVPMTPSEIVEEDKKRMDAAREALEEAERGEQGKLLVTQFNRGAGDNMRTNLEGMTPMTSEDLRAEEKNWKSRKRQQLEAEEVARQAKLMQTEFNRELGNMKRTNLEGMVPMTSEELKQEAREALEGEERRLQDELLRTRFNRGPGDNMRTVLEGMVSKSRSR
ncbi:hypothetical protein ONS95_003169 [Cadophora gregata]|uniref:uncharacterized protein n=1 Tax=Cadophora gregata TaxID=51156 RepID=UPI0026DC42C1|nr:uncharacterized protein ONS95_003169 [Cadophora gregata]KAK0108355.1 hypothetical protein ONS95_003169 [Cadophora gregata]